MHRLPSSQLSLVNRQWSIWRTKSCPAGRSKSMLRMVEIQPVAERNLRALRADGKARRTFVLRALFTPCLGVAAQQRRRMAAIYPASA